ncbi:Sulfate permease, MFS superfamily [Rhodoblastus acidophilus]|uniref:Sulfate permease, MFS superfamily n=1 Tax=Rhodoblastus acidophilus TaxID=1074 RepID=A0A212RLV5_RHOAC|nr:SulP family inorganic anion transporter [Rhodoblastus acidophilus]PPQ39214.1 SulP family inorganic anion transporter [Rhodoblastus acidophilus]RAI24239.1 SulP family inorganic anion transporter [Rhodoblastus acidophilus]SNB73476.1 Sulfate permease, MFS superfamily [Rhodoblastus acidophilus]
MSGTQASGRSFVALRGGARSWRADLLAGLTLAAIAAPEQMATARMGGFAPSIGFLAFIAGALGFALFGASRRMSVGADSTITPIFAASLATVAAAGSAQYAALAVLLALFVGAMMIAAGLFRAGWVANLLSIPVMTGFLAGVAVHIVLSQTPALLGLPSGVAVFSHLADIRPDSALIGLGALAAILAMEKCGPKGVAPLLAMTGAAAVSVGFGLEARGLPVIGPFSAIAPVQPIGAVSLDDLSRVAGLAVLLTLLVMTQGAAVSRAYAEEGESNGIDRDFIGLGAGSVLAGLIGAFPVNASPPRTAIVAESGGRSQWAGLTAAAVTALVAAFGEPALRHVPEAALAAILFYIAGRLIRLEAMRDIFHRSPAEFLLIPATAAAMTLLPAQIGVALAIILSLINGAWATTRADLRIFERLPGETVWWPRGLVSAGETLAGVAVVGFQAPLSFLNADQFRAQLLEVAGRPPTRLIVLEAAAIVSIDYTAARALALAIDECHARGCDFAIARLESVRAEAALRASGVMEALARHDGGGQRRIFHSVDEALRQLAGSAERDAVDHGEGKAPGDAAP